MAKAMPAQKKQTFRFVDPNAQNVFLVGDFTDWQKDAIRMKNDGNGVWTATVKLSPGTHDYLFIVDGVWCEDPDCTNRAPNPFGGLNMVRVVT